MKTLRTFTLALVLTSLAPCAIAQEDGRSTAEETWLPSLMTATPQEGFELAVTLARRGVATTQPDREVLTAGRSKYSHDPDSLIAASEVVAIHFRTIAVANDYWRDRSEQE
ncbi:MAG: hexameric tyrosine-coordinated heme protein [Gammaproteobacteria bacterium]|nr:hexameric tyrosine-coordinated heme protein [Gammaproteobacteria bacterium]